LRTIAKRITEVADKVTRWIQANSVLIVAAAKAVAVFGAIGAALVVGGTAMATFAAILTGVASVVGLAATAIGVIGTVIGAIASPVGIVVAAIAGLGAAILDHTGAGATAVAWLGDKFQKLKEVVGPVVQGIKDALSSGDLALAAEIGWLGVQLVFEQAKSKLVEVFTSMITEIRSTWSDFITWLNSVALIAVGPLLGKDALRTAYDILQTDNEKFQRRLSEDSKDFLDKQIAINARIGQLRSQLDAATGKAAGKAADAAKEPMFIFTPSLRDSPPGPAGDLEREREGEKVVDGLGDVMSLGTFSGRAALNLGIGPQQGAIQKDQLATLKKIEQNQKDGDPNLRFTGK